MANAETRRVKYVFLDVVNFTRDRSVEAQTDIVETLNGLVRDAVLHLGGNAREIVYLPTGDGMCIALLEEALPFDTHIHLALAIVERLDSYNQSTSDEMRKFQVRIGINENVDNIVVDINGQRNVAGAGINTAQRVMNASDGNQIMVGPAVFDTLRHRERYMRSFRHYQANVKHNRVLSVFQLIEDGHPGLSVAVPSAFIKAMPAEHRLTELEAFYIGHAIRLRRFFSQRKHRGQKPYAAAVLLWFLATDSVQERHRTEYSSTTCRTHGKGALTIDRAYEYYESIDFWVCAHLSDYVRHALADIGPYFDDDAGPQFYIVNERGKTRLRVEHPDIWAKLDLDET
jgi:class 3 adenylate cyclase